MNEKRRCCATQGSHGRRLLRSRHSAGGKEKIFTQTGLTKRIIEALGLNTKYSTAKSTQANTNSLEKDLDGPPVSGDINYASIIGMLLFLNHSQPDILFASHQCARLHENNLKQIRQ